MPFQKSAKTIPYEMKKLGEYLGRLREETNLSLRDVARETDLTPSYLFKV